MRDASEARAKEQSIRDYRAYIEEHVENTKRAFEILFASYLDADDETARALAGVDAATLREALEIAGANVAIHDASKYDDVEFETYRIHFYPTPEEKRLIEEGAIDDGKDFARAFARHVQLNPHHPPHWADDGRPCQDMPLEYVIEAICDWEAMSMKFGGSTPRWWKERAGKERATMTDDTIALFDQMIDVLFED